jgi:hypothetical protein
MIANIELWVKDNKMVVNTTKSMSIVVCSYQKRSNLESDVLELTFNDYSWNKLMNVKYWVC